MRVRYRWSTSATYGFVRTTTIRTPAPNGSRVATLDGLVDLLPYGLEPSLYHRLSNLTNAYKRSELIDPATRLAVFSLETPVSDRPEPEEVLRAIVAWSSGLDGPVSLDPRAVTRFEAGEDSVECARHGGPGDVSGTWRLRARSRNVEDVADRRRRRLRAVRRRPTPRGPSRRRRREAVLAGESRSDRGATGRHHGDGGCVAGHRRPVACAHHFANVTYNVMRGGVPLDGYRIHRRRSRRLRPTRATGTWRPPRRVLRVPARVRIERRDLAEPSRRRRPPRPATSISLGSSRSTSRSAFAPPRRPEPPVESVLDPCRRRRQRRAGV